MELKVCVQVGFEFVCARVCVCVYDYLPLVCGLPSKHAELGNKTHQILPYVCVCVCVCVCVYMIVQA